MERNDDFFPKIAVFWSQVDIFSPKWRILGSELDVFASNSAIFSKKKRFWGEGGFFKKQKWRFFCQPKLAFFGPKSIFFRQNGDFFLPKLVRLG